MNLVVFIHNIVFNFHVLKRNKIEAVYVRIKMENLHFRILAKKTTLF